MGARHCHFEFHPLPPIPTESRSTHHGDHKDVPRETWNANAMRRWMFYSGASWDDMDRWTRDRNFPSRGNSSMFATCFDPLGFVSFLIRNLRFSLVDAGNQLRRISLLSSLVNKFRTKVSLCFWCFIYLFIYFWVCLEAFFSCLERKEKKGMWKMTLGTFSSSCRIFTKFGLSMKLFCSNPSFMILAIERQSILSF